MASGSNSPSEDIHQLRHRQLQLVRQRDDERRLQDQLQERFHQSEDQKKMLATRVHEINKKLRAKADALEDMEINANEMQETIREQQDQMEKQNATIKEQIKIIADLRRRNQELVDSQEMYAQSSQSPASNTNDVQLSKATQTDDFQPASANQTDDFQPASANQTNDFQPASANQTNDDQPSSQNQFHDDQPASANNANDDEETSTGENVAQILEEAGAGVIGEQHEALEDRVVSPSAPENPPPILEEAELLEKTNDPVIDFQIENKREKEEEEADVQVAEVIALPTPSPQPAPLSKRGRPRLEYGARRRIGQGKGHHIGKLTKRHKKSADDDSLPLTEARIKEMKVVVLREELRRRKLSGSGLKAVLVERLLHYWRDNEEEHEQSKKRRRNDDDDNDGGPGPGGMSV